MVHTHVGFAGEHAANRRTNDWLVIDQQNRDRMTCGRCLTARGRRCFLAHACLPGRVSREKALLCYTFYRKHGKRRWCSGSRWEEKGGKGQSTWQVPCGAQPNCLQSLALW